MINILLEKESLARHGFRYNVKQTCNLDRLRDYTCHF